MKINYADRRNDNNILKKDFAIKDVDYMGFVGKVSNIKIQEIKEEFKVTRPDGSESVLLAKNYNIITFFPKDEKYCMTIMFDDKWNLLQWYFDIARNICKYDLGVPYSEDLYLDVVALPDGAFYILDEEELEEALNKRIVSKEEYNEAYIIMKKITQMIKYEFKRLSQFTNFCLQILKQED